MRNNMRMGLRIAVNMSLPKDLIDELDEVAGARNRSAFVEDSIRDRLRREQMRRGWESARGSWKDHPDFPTSESVIEWVRARRAESTHHGPDTER